MSLALKYPPNYTVKDYNKWEGNWELIDGVPYALASPSFEHQRIVGKIFRYIDEQLEYNCPKCKVGIDTDYIIDQHTVVRPNVFIICKDIKNKILEAPVVIFEVVSESTAQKDEKLKFELYEKEGVKFYILVFPEIKKAKAFVLNNGKYIKYKDFSKEIVELTIENCKFKIDFSKIFD